MYSIYFNDRIIRVCNKNITTPYNPNAAVLHSANNKTLQELPCLFEQNKNLKYLYIPILPDNLEETLTHLCSTLTPINAGGGLVQNTEGEYLLIFRNGLWDLPKGKQEEGISRCEWVPASRLPEYLQDTYPSIRKVFEEAGLI